MKFSIGIPAFKDKYLKKCIDSILQQTVSDFELIIVDDCSPNNLEKIVNKFDDERIRYYRNESNCGAVNVVDNWNICLSYAIGDYFICMGDDDELSPNCLEEYERLILNYPDLDIFHSRVKIIDENSDLIEYTEERPIYQSVYQLISHRMNGGKQFIGDFLFKTDTLKAFGGFYKIPLAWASDDISSFTIAKEKGIANTNTPTYYYRHNRYSIGNSGNNRIKLKAKVYEENWYRSFIAEDKMMSKEDMHLKDKIEASIFNRFRNERILHLVSDMKEHSIGELHYYLQHRSEYKLTYYIIFRSFISRLKSEFFK